MRLRLALLCLAAGTSGASPPDNWTLAVDRDPETWQDRAVLSVSAELPIADEYGREQVTPQLLLSCAPAGDDTLGVRVDWRRFISSFNTEVGFKVDDRELLLVNWGVDRSNRITLPRSAADAAELIDYLHGGRSLNVEVIPYSESLITVRFDISGFDPALKSLAARCAG